MKKKKELKRSVEEFNQVVRFIVNDRINYVDDPDIIEVFLEDLESKPCNATLYKNNK